MDFAIPEDDQCHMYKTVEPNSTECFPDAFLDNVTTTCSEWVYDTSMFTSTTVTEVRRETPYTHETLSDRIT